MTGFGRAEESIGDKTFLIDIKSLNGKQFELNLRLPAIIKPFDFNIRKIISEKLNRGSVECTISLKETGNAKPVTINTDLAKAYYKPLAELSEALKLDPSHILSTLVKLPEVITPTSETLTEAEWIDFQKVLQAAINTLDDHRQKEGKVMKEDIVLRIDNIQKLQGKVVELEPLRRVKIREGITRLLEENVGKENYDGNRLEQELIYYIEKIDISEEQVRLKNHCEYFKTIITDSENSKGKKLSFVIQEIGREINTIGSKAYDSSIQQCVVMMKDELEKAKEQLLNIL